MSNMVQTIAGSLRGCYRPQVGSYAETVWHFVGAHPCGRWARK